MKRKFLVLLGFASGIFAGSVLFRRSFASRATTSTSTSTTARWSRSPRARPRPRSSCPSRRTCSPQHAGERIRSLRRSWSTRISRATSCFAPANARATTWTSTASRRGPSCCGRSASASPRRCASTRPTRAARRARARRGRARGGCVARLRSAVPDRPQGGQGVRDRQPPRRALRARASASASSRTSSPPAARCSSRSTPLREAGLVVHTAVCVVDREEGGADALAREAVRLRPLFRASELARHAK